MVVQDEDALTEEGTCNGGTGGGFLVDTPHWGCVITLVVGVSKGGGVQGVIRSTWTTSVASLNYPMFWLPYQLSQVT